MTAKILRFVINPSAGINPIHDLGQRFLPGGRYVLNKTEWRGKEPRSCAVTNVSSRSTSAGEPMVVNIEVTYRPKGYISYVGETRYDAWTATCIKRRQDSTLLNEKDEPLEDGQTPGYATAAVYQDVDYNTLDFGEFVEEVDVPGVPREKFEDLINSLKEGGSFSISAEGAFVAPHRTRPLRKIILSNAQSGRARDGFGTEIVNINLSTPHLEQVLMEQLATLMYDFLEGRASVKTMENEEFAFVELSDSLVDCEPNEYGQKSLFNVLQGYTPMGFMEDLAKRLESIYRIKVSVVEGINRGLVLRHDRKK